MRKSERPAEFVRAAADTHSRASLREPGMDPTCKLENGRLLAIIFGIVCVPLLTFSSAPAQASQNQSTLTVSFVLKRGRLAVDRDRSSFVFSDTFKTRITESPGRVDAELAKA